MAKGFIPLKRLVKTDLRILEPTQIEASFQYRMVVKGEDEKVAYPASYSIESYFLFPQQMKVSPSTYPLEYFYRDLKSFLNFRIPKLTFKEIMGYVDDPDRSPLLKIREHISHGIDSPEERTFIIQEAQIFACSFYTFITRKSRKIVTGLARFEEDGSSTNRMAKLIEESFQKVNVIFLEWQKVLQEAEVVLPTIKRELREVDEYVVNNIHDFLLKAQKSLDMHTSAQTREWRGIVRARLRALRIYSGQNAYLWIDDKSDELALEAYLHRRGFLKRQVWSALYLNTRTKSLFKLQRQAGAMVAAGVAGFWAALANLLLGFTSGSSARGASVGQWGFSTFIVITALTFAYILKDRIKELGRTYFKGSMFRDLPDSSSKIVYRPSGDASKALEIGFHEEKVEFVEVEDLPEKVQGIIEKMAPERLNAESLTVIHYRKRIGLDGEKIQELKRKIRALYTFFRLNVTSFIAPLDLPFEEIAVSTSRLGATVRQVPKVYYLDLILHITTLVAEEQKSEFEYYRLVLDKRGVKRIQKLSIEEPKPEGSAIPHPMEIVSQANPDQGGDDENDLDEERDVIHWLA